MTFGLFPEGLLPPRLTDIRTEINQRLQSLFGAVIDVSDESVEGQAAGIVSERLVLVWELLEVLHGAIDPNKANDSLLEALCALTGTFRNPASYSVVNVILTGAPAVVVPGDSQVSTGVEAGRFLTVGDATLLSVDSWFDTDYAAGSFTTNGGNVYYAPVGAASGLGAPTHTGREGIPFPGSPAEKWLWLGGGTAMAEKLCRAAVTGPVFAPAAGYTVIGAIEVIDTPIGGWEGVVNLVDVTLGAHQQRDESLRLSREAELAAQGNSPIDGLRGRLLRISGVEAVTIFFNNTDSYDADGLPPHSVEAMVQGGDDDVIRAVLWASVAGGILTHGQVVGTIVDSQDREQTIKFSRHEGVEVWVELEVEVDAGEFPDDGIDQIKAAIVARGQIQPSGMDARSFAIGASALAIDGVLTVLEVLIGTAPNPTLSATIPISLRQRAIFITANLTVLAFVGVP